MSEDDKTAAWADDRDIRRSAFIGICLGVPLGWVSFPLVLWCLGFGMEFYR